jgi:amidohydrolase
VKELAPDYIAVRHHLHQNPELSDHEEQTAAVVAAQLRAIGLDAVRTGVGGHGVIGELRGMPGGEKMLAIRADMDALPIQELNDVGYRSCKPGVMHACGHDGHTSTLLGTAATLARLRDQLAGTVRFVFQPAEETVGGAERMCAEGAMEGVDAVLALHGWPGMDVGSIGVRTGPMMASSDTFDIVILGKGAHAAMPHAAIDPIMIGAYIVTALQTLSSREVSPVDPVVVTVAQFHAGTAYNVIPDRAEIKGTVRCLTEEHRRAMPDRIKRIAEGICAAFRAQCEFRYRLGTGVTSNTADMVDLISGVARDALGEQSVVSLAAPSMGAEDFAAYLKYAPGVMFRLGVGTDSPNLHTPTYNFADEAVPVGMELFSRAAIRFLAGA